MFRSLLAAVPLMLPVTTFAADGLGVLHTFRDWEVGCDNTRRCEAQGYGKEGSDAHPAGNVALIIRRDAGPGQRPSLHFVYSSFDEKAPMPDARQAVRLQVGALRFELPPPSPEQAQSEVPASHVPALLEAVQKGDVIRLSTDSAQWQVSLDGAAAALLKMDDLQGRVGTPGALVRPGTKPESSVPVPAVPVVKAARLPATTAADRALVPKLAAVLLGNPDGCPDFDPAQDLLDVVRLDSTTLLALQPCGRGAYQFGSFTLVWRVDAQPPHKARPLGLPTPDGRTANGLVTEGLGVGDTLNLHEAGKLRGIGDCWVTRHWTWTGQRLALVSASQSACRMFEAGGLDVGLWRSQLK